MAQKLDEEEASLLSLTIYHAAKKVIINCHFVMMVLLAQRKVRVRHGGKMARSEGSAKDGVNDAPRSPLKYNKGQLHYVRGANSTAMC
jgi:hypothetical protein